MPESIISVKSLIFSYPGKAPVIKNATFEISPGEIVAITGLSGSGKTTLAYILKGLIPHSIRGEFSGDVIVANYPVKTTKISTLAAHVGMVFQDLNSQLFSATVIEEIRFGLRNMHLDLAWADEALQHLQIEHLRDHNPLNLSAGQKQRVILASVIATKPKILILDEPSAHLDAPSKVILRDWLRQLNQERGITIILIDQDPWMVGELCSRALLIDGHTVSPVSMDRVLTKEPTWRWAL
jgi:energy-coupling factor transport system ATP-binding protein